MLLCPYLNFLFFWGGGFLQEEPERPKGQERIGKSRMMEESYQLWHQTGEVCPEGTIPVRRTTEEDMMRASTIKRFGRKPPRLVRRDSSSSDHEVSLGFFLFLKKKKREIMFFQNQKKLLLSHANMPYTSVLNICKFQYYHYKF